MREKDEIDLLLDSALSTYADPGAHAGLEDRVLATLATARINGGRRVIATRPWLRWLPWAVAIPVAAMLLFLWLSPTRDHPSPRSDPQMARHPEPAPIRPPVPEFRPEIAHHENRPAVRAQPPSPIQEVAAEALPKLDVFPTPQPLTPEEHALVVAANSGSEPERHALLEAQEPDAPLDIADLRIKPLATPDEGQN